MPYENYWYSKYIVKFVLVMFDGIIMSRWWSINQQSNFLQIPLSDQEILRKLEKEKILVFTPSRRVQGRRVVCYDDRFIVKLAYDSDGIIVSNDNYRDLQNEKPEWKKFIEERLLMYSFVNDK